MFLFYVITVTESQISNQRYIALNLKQERRRNSLKKTDRFGCLRILCDCLYPHHNLHNQF